LQPNLNHTAMFKVKHKKHDVVTFEGIMELEEVLKLKAMDKLIKHLLSLNENFYLIVGVEGACDEEWNIFYTV
jgi:hypothetical protein